MARPREFDTDEAIEAICRKFWSDGYETTGISALEDATGLARARLYGAFGSKQEMLYHAIDHYMKTRIDVIFSRVDDAGIEGVLNFFNTFATIAVENPEQAHQGCLVVNSMIELGNSDPGVIKRASHYRQRVCGAFRSALHRTAQDGRLLSDVDRLTDLAFIMLMGLYVAVKSGADADEIKRLCRVAIETVESWKTHPRARHRNTEGKQTLENARVC